MASVQDKKKTLDIPIDGAAGGEIIATATYYPKSMLMLSWLGRFSEIVQKIEKVKNEVECANLIDELIAIGDKMMGKGIMEIILLNDDIGEGLPIVQFVIGRIIEDVNIMTEESNKRMQPYLKDSQ